MDAERRMFLHSLSTVHPSQFKHIGPLVNGWKTGTIISATVKSNDINSVVQLQIGKNTIQARSSKPLPVGERLRLQVENNQGDVILRRLSTDIPSPRSEALNRHLKENLPRSRDLLTSFTRLEKIQQILIKEHQHNPLPATLKHQIAELLSAIPGQKDLLTSSQVKEAIQDSGVFLESRLKENSKAEAPAKPDISRLPYKTDLKANLLKVVALLDEQIINARIGINSENQQPKVKHHDMQVMNPGEPVKISEITTSRNVMDLLELRSTLEAAVSRIQINQSSSFINNEMSSLPWLVEIPIRNTKNELFAQLAVQYQRSSDETERSADKHVINLTMELDSLGTIHAEIKLSNNKIYSSMWSDNKRTQGILETNIHKLKERFEKAGLNVGVVANNPRSVLRMPVNISNKSLLSTRI